MAAYLAVIEEAYKSELYLPSGLHRRKSKDVQLALAPEEKKVKAGRRLTVSSFQSYIQLYQIWVWL
jgi:hypothetical protein